MTAPLKDLRSDLEIRPIASARQFLDLQRAFYRGDRDYVPPITAAEAWQIEPAKNPFFAHAEVTMVAAFRDGRCVGRVSACRDRLHDEFHGDRVGFFGHFEAADEATAAALLEHAARWCRERSATALRGPVDLSTNYKCGLLIDGTAGPPVMMMPYNPKCYADWIEAAGLQKAKDLLALHGTSQSLDRPRMDKLTERITQRTGITLRRVDLRRFDAECRILWDLYERIWERNWGFVPMTEGEFLAQAKDLKKVAHPALLHIAEKEGAPIGFVLALPDTNVGAKACDGRLLPFGWWRFLRAMKQKHLIRVLTLGALPEYRKTGIDMLLMHRVMSQGIDAGFDACEASWILEDNKDMLGPLETLGCTPYRRYRIYERPLT
ncbi:MAG: N-acetyltransferase [Planctomycetes bacterium]|nr:N-acetyltransferase [Planctomycetota bacterium]